MKFNTLIATLGLAGLSLAGCATSGDSFGDQVTQVSDQWQKGEKNVRDGKRMVERGEDEIKKGEKLQKHGARDEKKALVLLAEARENLATRVALVGDAESGEAIEAEANELKDLERAVDKAEKAVKAAQKEQKRGRDDVSDGKKKIAKGKDLIEKGRKQMNEAKEEYRDIEV